MCVEELRVIVCRIRRIFSSRHLLCDFAFKRRLQVITHVCKAFREFPLIALRAVPHPSENLELRAAFEASETQAKTTTLLQLS